MQTKFNIGDSVYYFSNKDNGINWLGCGKVTAINITEDSIVLYHLTTTDYALAEDELSSTPARFYEYKIGWAEDSIRQLKEYVERLKAEKEEATQKCEEDE